VPADERAIRLYLASGMIRGIGPILASAIVDAFGEQTLKVIDAEPQRFLEVHGIGQGRLGRIAAAWQEQKAIVDIMVFLQGLQITPALAVKIYTEPRPQGRVFGGVETIGGELLVGSPGYG
jgi:exodeoxyribonuclease V alpha subunit